MVELWLVDLQAAASALAALEREAPRLGPGDRAYAARLRAPADRQHRLAVYAALRILLERVGGPRVRGQRIVRAAGEKPRLAAGSPAFSLSHTQGFAVIGVGRSPLIGVDVECRRSIGMSQRRREEILAVASGLSAPPLTDAAEDVAVLRAWCRLEACAKARGTGVSRLLGELGLREARGRELAPAAIEDAARRLARTANLVIADMKLPAGLFGAVAAPRSALPSQPRRFPTTTAGIARLVDGAWPTLRQPGRPGR